MPLVSGAAEGAVCCIGGDSCHFTLKGQERRRARGGQSRRRPLNGRVPSGLVILYATVSGNAEQLALAAAQALRAHGHVAEVHNAADFPAARLREYRAALLIVSTWGEGEPPPDAADFFAALEGEPSLELRNLNYAVLALGSSMYRDFCASGRRVDEDLARHGARRLLDRVECDTKFKADFERWLGRVQEALQKLS
ncbi:MAG: hypothetical protein C0518_02190 [Opitutus sp.]|nr:hypothetical protein [Opitutus sp.]